MNYRALDNIGYMLNGEYFQLNKNANISQEIALKYFTTQGVIDGLVHDGRLEVVGGMSATKKVKDGLAEIAESIPFFKKKGVIDGLVDDGSLNAGQLSGELSASQKVKEGLAEIAESIVETVKDFGKK